MDIFNGNGGSNDVLDKIVREMLDKHGGGEVFFDHLDEALLHVSVIDNFLGMFISSDTPDDTGVVGSGKFGRFITNLVDEALLLVNGGLRSGRPIDDLSYIADSIRGRDFVFLDDSFYSGKTRDAIKAEIERHGGRLIRTYVIYDGSKEKDPTVYSLFRYYDN